MIGGNMIGGNMIEGKISGFGWNESGKSQETLS
jgi:hypothetical protein